MDCKRGHYYKEKVALEKKLVETEQLITILLQTVKEIQRDLQRLHKEHHTSVEYWCDYITKDKKESQ
jgi:hypothetical protein